MKSKKITRQRQKLRFVLTQEITRLQRTLRRLDRVDAEVFAAGMEYFEAEKYFAIWLSSPVRALGHKAPVELLRTARGKARVMEVLATLTFNGVL